MPSQLLWVASRSRHAERFIFAIMSLVVRKYRYYPILAILSNYDLASTLASMNHGLRALSKGQNRQEDGANVEKTCLSLVNLVFFALSRDMFTWKNRSYFIGFPSQKVCTIYTTH